MTFTPSRNSAKILGDAFELRGGFMGVHHKEGYSATVEGFFIVGGNRVRVAKSNGERFVLADPCEAPPGTEGELLVIVDGNEARGR